MCFAFRTGIRGDGRCLFRSVVHGASLRAGKPSPSDSLQRELADELRSKVHDELKFTEFRRILMLFCHTISYVKWWYDLDRWSMNSSDGGPTPNGKFRKDLTNLYLDNFCLDADLNCFENHFQSLVESCFELFAGFLKMILKRTLYRCGSPTFGEENLSCLCPHMSYGKSYILLC